MPFEKASRIPCFVLVVLAPYIYSRVHVMISCTLVDLSTHELTSEQALAGHYLGGYTFIQPLILALAYTFSQDNADRVMSFFIISFPGKYLPYALLFVTFVLGGPQAAKFQAVGLLAAHFYDFVTRIWPTFGGGTNYIRTPAFVKRLFGGDGSRPTPQTRGFGTSFAAPRAQPPPSTGWSNQRGPGRRLGGE